MIYRSLLIIIYLFSLPFFSQTNQSKDLHVSGDYTHLWTKTVFPSLWAGFQRQDVRSYDSKNQNVGISYIQQLSKKKKTVLTIYIYPQKEIDNHNLRDQFLSYDYALNQNSGSAVELKPLFGSLSNDLLKVNYIYSVFSNSMGKADFFSGVKYTDKQSLLAIYECGGWNVKIRVTSDDMTKDQLLELKQKTEAYFNILTIAAIKLFPYKNEPDIVLSPAVQRDSMMTKAMIAAAKSKIEWSKNNLDKKEILTGFNDMKIDSEVYATEKMVEFYKLHKNDWPIQPETEKYFNEMIRIVENKKTKDHIYEKFHYIVDYPEGESQKANYIQFKIDHDISEDTNEYFYKIFYTLE
ncbi:hypothetical protein [Chryseobacterium profundimaris]|uniref:Uncharacterized protein n=1 Tax=Chryseobacterium profundimaris TaxID=1387275 RepID=A0ABY1NCL3_9FLAO|nr:hypothetical protein [Chryseobacterium profundimaris]SMP05974.1 hypothetical protein SAMN06264346_101473 [Chryseobacterium profundimaris]